ncbi:MAG: cell division protein ZapA [Thermodesulfovibrionales bacterium]|nr:cell division protein ZapA [Thermodesulfovibrionales bacterium]
MQAVEVTILGKKYKIKSDYPPDYISELAEYVDSKLTELLKKMPSLHPLKAAIITSIIIADELKRAKSEIENTKKSLKIFEDKTETIIKLFDEKLD